MNKKLLWVLTLLFVALMPLQDANAAYCGYDANMKGGDKSRKLNSFTLSDGINSVSVSNIQTSFTDAVYKDKTSSVLTTTAGSELRFTSINWEGGWMHGYVYIDYNKDETFNQTVNANGTTGGELVSFSYYQNKNSLGATIAQNEDGSTAYSGGVTTGTMPAWALPSDLAVGTYRLRFKIDWDSADPCGVVESGWFGRKTYVTAENGGCLCDITIKIEEPISDVKVNVTVGVNDDDMGRAISSHTGEVNENTSITLTATPASGYTFVNWTKNGEVVSSANPYTVRVRGNSDYVANFCKTLDRSAWRATASSEKDPEGASGDGPASYAINNASNGWWHSNYDVSPIPTVPHWIQFDLGSEQAFDAFNYVSRTGNTNDCNGNVKTYSLYVSNSDISANLGSSYVPNNATRVVNGGTFTYSGDKNHIVKLDQMYSGRYVYMLITDTYNVSQDAKFANCDEFYLYQYGSPSFKVTVSSSDEAKGIAYIGTEGTTEAECDSEGTETVTLTAEAAEGYEFVNWTLDGVVVSTDAVYTTTAVTEDRAYVANFKFKPVAPREVTVVANDASKGSVAIVSPATSETTITTGEMVTVEATAIGSDNAFANWTINGVVVGTEPTYTYIGEEAATIQANFGTRYLVNIASPVGGTITVTQGSTVIENGDRVAEGAIINITVKGSGSNWVKTLTVNGENMLPSSQEKQYTAQVTVSGATTILATFGAPDYILTYEYSGNGYIEVWSSDSFNEGDEETFPVAPAGDKFNMWDEVPEEGICIFVFPGAGAELVSITVNGEDKTYDEEFVEYGDIFYEPTEPVHIVAEFSGEATGVESAEFEGADIYATAEGIVVEAADAINVEVYSIAGALVAEKNISGVTTIAVAKGVYIVKAGDKVSKVVVK